MGKVGKYSTGLTGEAPMSKHSGGGNRGYMDRANLMGDSGMTKHHKQGTASGVTAQGGDAPTIVKNVKRKT